MTETPEPLNRLWQLLWSCCDEPTPFVLSALLIGIEPAVVVVVCGNCEAAH